MKIAIISDTHLGYMRFYEDSFKQAEKAFMVAQKRADVIIFAGDMFDSKIPSLDTMEKAVRILREIKVPIYGISGNHERRMHSTDVLKVFESARMFKKMRRKGSMIEKNGEEIFVVGMNSLPEDLAEKGLEKLMGELVLPKGIHSILVLHQTLGMGGTLLPEKLDGLPFELIVNGHMHEHSIRGKILQPGSTVITQLKKEETKPKGFCIYDTKTKEIEFKEIDSRKFIMETLEFEDAGIHEVKERTQKQIEEIDSMHNRPIIRIDLKGTLKQGLKPQDIIIEHNKDVFLENMLNETMIAEKIKEIRKQRKDRTTKEIAEQKLREKLKDRLEFDAYGFFEAVAESVEKGERFLLEGKNG